MDLSDLTATLIARAMPLLRADLTTLGEAIAADASAHAPYRTGRLRASLAYRETDPLSGVLTIESYGIFVDRGHRVARWNTARGRTRPMKTDGTVLPNPFLTTAIQTASPVLRVLGPEGVAHVRAGLLRALADART